MPLSIKRNAPLQAHNTLAVNATAAAIVEVQTLDELKQALAFARNNNWPFVVLGEGSNIVFAENYAGLVILNRLTGIELLSETEAKAEVRAAAGENWHQFVTHCVEQGWFGLENLALIPGTVGAAPIQNIGAYGVELDSCIVSVEVLDTTTQEVVTLAAKDCGFAYRDSYFKHHWQDKYVILTATFKLHRDPSLIIDSYPALASRLEKGATAYDVFLSVMAIRTEKLPDPSKVPNVGSFFKNPVIDLEQFEKLSERYPDLVAFPVDEDIKLAAAWLIEQRGWKKRSVQDVRVHEQQALVVINPKHKDGQAVMALATAIKKDIYQLFDVELQIEPRVIGRWDK